MGEVVMKPIMRMSSLQEAHYAATVRTYATNSSSKNSNLGHIGHWIA
jgi:hypothetical protein